MASRFGRIVGVRALVAFAFAGSLAPCASAEKLGRITFTAPAFCDTGSAKVQPVRIPSLSYYLRSDSGVKTAVPTFEPNGNTITWSASVEPGVYLYSFTAWGSGIPGDDTSEGFCSTGNRMVVVLPGDSVRAYFEQQPFHTYAFDNVFRPLVVYGVAPPSVRIRLEGFPVGSAPPCGSRVSNWAPAKIDVRHDSIGFWSDGFAPLNATGQNAKPILALGLQVGSTLRYIRIDPGHPAMYIGLPRSLRFDLTQARLRTALASAPDTLLCL
jgi:hypothetical protein